MSLRRVAIAALVGSSLPLFAQCSVGHEEDCVRQFYARITYLSQISTLSNVALDESRGAQAPMTAQALAGAVRSQQVNFTITKINVGQISDIANQPWTSFVTPDSKMQHLLRLDMGTVYMADDHADTETWYKVTANWQPVNLSNLDLAGQVFGYSVKTMMDNGSKQFVTPDVTYTRYAAYTISTSYAGEQAGPYQAMFLFGKNAGGQDVISVQDLGNEGSASLAIPVFHQRLYPTGLARTGLRDTQDVATWLLDHAAAEISCSQANSQGVCCTGDHCAVISSTLSTDLAAPLHRKTESLSTSR